MTQAIPDPVEAIAPDPSTDFQQSSQPEKPTYNPLFEAVDQFSKVDKRTASVQQLFQRFLKLPVEERMQCVNAYLLARCITGTATQTAAIEFLKELGRNERALLAIEKGALGDDSSPWL